MKTTPHNNSGKPWAIYIRVSTEDQGQKYSPAAQRRTCAEKIRQLGGGEVPEEMVFLDEKTGADTNRPAFQRLRATVKSRLIAGVMIYSLDRFSRDVVDCIALKREFKSHDVQIEFVNLTVDDTPVGEFMYTLMAAVGQLERKIFAQRSRDGRIDKALAGFLNNGAVPYGYQYIGKDQNSRGTMKIYEPQAKIVRMIFGWAKAGKPTRRIAFELNDRRIPTQRGALALARIAAGKERDGDDKTKNQLWSRNVVHQMLRNRAYMGKYESGKGRADAITIDVPAIVDALTFASVSLQLKRTREANVGRPSRDYLLTGMIWCRRCGRRCTTRSAGKRPAYLCGNMDPCTAKRKCRAPQIQQRLAEETVWSAIWETITQPDVLWAMTKAYHAEMATGADQRPALETKMKKLEAKAERTVEMLQDRLIAYNAGKKQVETLRAEIEVLRDELVRLNLVALPAKFEVNKLASTFLKGPAIQGFNERRELLQKFGTTIRYADGELEITGAIPLGDGLQLPKAGGNGQKPNGNGQKNCHSSVPRTGNSLGSIPFKILRRVA